MYNIYNIYTIYIYMSFIEKRQPQKPTIYTISKRSCSALMKGQVLPLIATLTVASKTQVTNPRHEGGIFAFFSTPGRPPVGSLKSSAFYLISAAGKYKATNRER
jgi:hypothetical protein